MNRENVDNEKRNEVYEIFQKLDANSQNILIVAGSCMLARQQMEEEEKAVG